MAVSPFRSYVDYLEAPSSVQWQADYAAEQACKRFRGDPGSLTDDDVQWIRLFEHSQRFTTSNDPITYRRAVEARDSARDSARRLEHAKREATQAKRERALADMRRVGMDALGTSELSADHERVLDGIAALCEQYDITIRWAPIGSLVKETLSGRNARACAAPKSAGIAGWENQIYIPPIVDLDTCATAYHEIGHCATSWSADSFEIEMRAWRFAMEHMPAWTIGCHRRMSESLRSSFDKQQHKSVEHAALVDVMTSDAAFMKHARAAPTGFSIEKRFKGRTVEKQAIDEAAQPDTTNHDLVARIAKLEEKSVAFRGVYQNGQKYERGDLAIHQGALWVCRNPTMAVPGGPMESSRAWQLATKAGSLSK